MPRKIIHIDMDCFYAAIEIRDNPALANKPIAVGGSADKRGVICTCNYLARKFGVHSAMATATAYRLCPQLELLPVNMPKYRRVAKHIHQIFRGFSDLVEPLALDEAYIDVSHTQDYQNSATLIAKAIREKIWQQEQLIASAGVAPNKLLAKIASGWKKPNGFFVIEPQQITNFIANLPVAELHGVGKVTAKKLHALQIYTCLDLQKISAAELMHRFGKMGEHLYQQCRGIDDRPVEPNRMRKSLSVEKTFAHDMNDAAACLDEMTKLYESLIKRLQHYAPNHAIKNQFIKIKFSDFKAKTAETISYAADLDKYLALFRQTYHQQKPIRLLGLGVHFDNSKEQASVLQESLW